MALKFKGGNSERHSAKPNAVELLRAEVNTVLGDSPFYSLLYVVCEVWDEAIRSGNTYYLGGATRDQSTQTFTVTIRGEKQTLYANNGLLDLLEQIGGLLQL